MAESDPHELADQLQHEADRLAHEGERLGDELASTREDWEHKRADPAVPGAAPIERPDDEEQPESPAPQAPPPEEGPSASENASELAVGPPADANDDSDANDPDRTDAEN